MKNGSTTSTARRVVDDCGQPLREPRRRKRDARFWDWILTVYTTNPSLRERWPGMRAVRIRETFVIREAAMARLDVYDPELYRAVSWVQAKDTKRTGPLSRVRAEFRPPVP